MGSGIKRETGADMASQRTGIKGIFRETNGMFSIRITKKDPFSGKIVEKRKKINSFSLEEAIEAKREMVSELGSELTTGKDNFRDIQNASYRSYIEWYLQYQLDNGEIRKNVWKLDRGIYEKHILPLIGNVKLSSISKRGVLYFIENLRNSTDQNGLPYSKSTYKRIWALMKKSLRFAVKMNWLENDPTYLVSPKFPNGRKAKEKIAFTKDEANKLLEAAKSESFQFYFICLIAIVNGLRFAEITALTYGDLDFENDCIIVNKSFHRGVLNNNVKNNNSHNSPFTDIVRNAAFEYAGLYGRNKKLSDLLFPSKVNTHRDISGINNKLKKVCRKADLPEISFHTLRATCNTIYLQSNVQQPVVAKIMNHSGTNSEAMTFLYNRMGQKQKQTAMEQVWKIDN